MFAVPNCSQWYWPFFFFFFEARKREILFRWENQYTEAIHQLTMSTLNYSFCLPITNPMTKPNADFLKQIARIFNVFHKINNISRSNNLAIWMLC